MHRIDVGLSHSCGKGPTQVQAFCCSQRALLDPAFLGPASVWACCAAWLHHKCLPLTCVPHRHEAFLQLQLRPRSGACSALQVLEVLNDKDVRLLSEGAAPMSYPQRVQAKAGEADLKQARWQWPGAQQDSRVPQGSAA